MEIEAEDLEQEFPYYFKWIHGSNISSMLMRDLHKYANDRLGLLGLPVISPDDVWDDVIITIDNFLASIEKDN